MEISINSVSSITTIIIVLATIKNGDTTSTISINTALQIPVTSLKSTKVQKNWKKIETSTIKLIFQTFPILCIQFRCYKVYFQYFSLVTSWYSCLIKVSRNVKLRSYLIPFHDYKASLNKHFVVTTLIGTRKLLIQRKL